MTFWFDDPATVRGLPMLYRLYAAYSRLMADRSTGLVRGGSLALSLLIAIMRTLRLRRDALVQVRHVKVWIDLCDRRMLWVLGELSTPGHEERILRARLSEGDTFLDLGANHGSYSLLAAPMVGRGGAVLAFEPHPHLASLVKRSFDANGFDQGAVLEVACSDRSGTFDFFVPSAGSGSGSLYERFTAGTGRRRIQVKTVRLDDAIEWERLPGALFVKLDVEGGELPALQGAEGLLRARRPPILFELSPMSAAAAGYSVADLLHFLASVGYRRFAEIDRYPETISVEDVDVTRHRNIVAVPD